MQMRSRNKSAALIILLLCKILRPGIKTKIHR